MSWSSLAGVSHASGWQAIPVSGAGPLDLRAGRRFPDNAEAVLVGFPTAGLAAAEKLPEGQGFAVERADPTGSGGLWLALTKKPAGNAELFADMACNVAEALDRAAADGADEFKLLRIFLGRVRAWQEFMRKGAQPLGPEAEIGLVGELAVLSALIDAGVIPATAARSWVGPFDQPQDFEIGTGALEVKTTISTMGFTATIGSLEQLDDAVRHPLFLVAVTLRQVASGLTLAQIASAAREKTKIDPEASGLLEDRLLGARYLDAHAASYTRRFDLCSIKAVEVAAGFPRLTSGNVPNGILRATYDVDIGDLVNAGADIAGPLKRLGAI